MNYQEFKKLIMPSLDKKMAAIEFVREKTSTPTYWKFPNDDRRLAWVVSLDFSQHGNPYFEVLIAPYWIPCQHKDEPFPRSVSYIGHLSPDGFQPGQYTWKTKTEEDAEKSIQEVLDALTGPGLDWFKQFSTPLKLLKTYRSAKLAADMGKFELAMGLYSKELNSSFGELLVEKKTNHSTPYESVRDWEIERHERIIEEFKDVLLKMDLNAKECERKVLHVELESLLDEKKVYTKDVAKDPKSRWYKSQLKYCDNRIEQINKELS